jgi:glycosyltransferase involved in cell wall biosynthesis
VYLKYNGTIQMKNIFRKWTTKKPVQLMQSMIQSEFSRLSLEGKSYKEMEKSLNKYLLNRPDSTNKIYRGFFSAIKDSHTSEALKIGELILNDGAEPSFIKVLATRYKRLNNYSRYGELISIIGDKYSDDKQCVDIKKHINKLVEKNVSSVKLEPEVSSLLAHFPKHTNLIYELSFAIFKDTHMELATDYGVLYLEGNLDNKKFADILIKRLTLLENTDKVAQIKSVMVMQEQNVDTYNRVIKKKLRQYKENLIETAQKNNIPQLTKFITESLNKNGYSEDIYKSTFAVLKESHKEFAISFGLGYLNLVPDDQKFLNIFSTYCLQNGTESEIKMMNEIRTKADLLKSKLGTISKNIFKRNRAFNQKEFRQNLDEIKKNIAANKLEDFISIYLVSYKSHSSKIHELSFSVLKDSHTEIALIYGRKYIEFQPNNNAFAKVFIRRLINCGLMDEAVNYSRSLLEIQRDSDLENIVFKYDIKQELTEAEQLFNSSKLDELDDFLSSMVQKYSDSLHYLYSAIHKFYVNKDYEKSVFFAEKSLELGNSPTVIRSLYDVHLTQGNLSKAINSIPADVTNNTLINKRKNGESFKDLLLNGFPIPSEPITTSYEAIPGKVFYMLHNRLPYNSGGYATRSHGLLTGVSQFGWDMHGVSRLGYPWDKMPEKLSSEVDNIDDIYYHSLKNGEIGLGKLPIKEYLIEYAKELTKLVEKEKPEFIHAASNYMNGVVANYVAKSLGIKSIYEVRGLWEITRISRQPEWKGSEFYNLMSKMEAEAAKNADVVFTLTEALKDEMISRGVDENKIELLPNGVNSGRFLPRERNNTLATKLGIENKVVIGFIGSVVGYEGLDCLVTATEILLNKGLDNFAVLIVGDGSAWYELKEDVKVRGLDSTIIFTGRVPHDQVEDYYSIVDIAPFPRKGIPVCEMVSPLKPFEAMSMEKAIISSNVAALAEFVFEGENGLLFEKDNVQDLAFKLEKLILDGDLREKLGKQAREWVVEKRDWKVITKKLSDVYSYISNH